MERDKGAATNAEDLAKEGLPLPDWSAQPYVRPSPVPASNGKQEKEKTKKGNLAANLLPPNVGCPAEDTEKLEKAEAKMATKSALESDKPLKAAEEEALPLSHVFEPMINSKPYWAGDPYIQKIATKQSRKVKELNAKQDNRKREVLLRSFLKCQDDAYVAIVMPFFCEYAITIGKRTLIGPNVQIYISVHPVRPEEQNRLRGKEWAESIKTGKDCWIGGTVIILPKITIGNGSTVGAGSVVTRDVEPRSLVVGNPAELIKRVD
ncbi:Hexapep domain-containing protein [Rhizoctonia solani AG-1 IA]|uniref:Hexapep domain-containing protein n=1 Tax=Thanatephorus cucumeris (strain AG1-IA) TaxID=983506 RepID=L8WK17_THACA|nr:Hexapep domain-containing protein [Rhizoctonia solani AG-1 IA]